MKDNIPGAHFRMYIMKYLFVPLPVHDMQIQFEFLVMDNPKQLLASKD